MMYQEPQLQQRSCLQSNVQHSHFLVAKLRGSASAMMQSL